MPSYNGPRAPNRRWSSRFNKIWRSTPPSSPLQISEPTLKSTTTPLVSMEGEPLFEKPQAEVVTESKPRVGPRSSSLSTLSNASVYLVHEKGDCDSLAALPELTELYESSNTTSMSPQSGQMTCDPRSARRQAELERMLDVKDHRIQELENMNKVLSGQLAMAKTLAQSTELEAKLTIVEYRAALEQLKEVRVHELKERNSIQVCQTVLPSSSKNSPQASSRYLPHLMAQALSENKPLSSPLESARSIPAKAVAGRPISTMSRARGLRPLLPITG